MLVVATSFDAIIAFDSTQTVIYTQRSNRDLEIMPNQKVAGMSLLYDTVAQLVMALHVLVLRSFKVPRK